MRKQRLKPLWFFKVCFFSLMTSCSLAHFLSIHLTLASIQESLLFLELFSFFRIQRFECRHFQLLFFFFSNSDGTTFYAHDVLDVYWKQREKVLMILFKTLRKNRFFNCNYTLTVWDSWVAGILSGQRARKWRTFAWMRVDVCVIFITEYPPPYFF